MFDEKYILPEGDKERTLGKLTFLIDLR